MTLGINTFLFCSPFSNTNLSLLPSFNTWGFDCAEIAIEDPSLVDGHTIHSAYQDSGLSHIITCGAYGPGRDLRGTSTEQHAALDYTKQVLDMMPLYNSTLYCGPLYSAVGHARAYSDDEKERQKDRVSTHLTTLCEYAAERGIRIAMEVLNRFETDFMNSAAQAVEIVERVNHAALKIHLDTFHMNIEENSIPEAIRTAGPHLAHLHASANHRGSPGTGTIPWTEIKKSLDEINYPGDIVIESFSTHVATIARACCVWRDPGKPETIARNGLKYLRSIFD